MRQSSVALRNSRISYVQVDSGPEVDSRAEMQHLSASVQLDVDQVAGTRGV